MSVKNRVRKAGITIEMLLASVLAMVVMFMVLGLFSDNLKLMISSSNFNKLFKRTAATEYEKANRDYSESQVTVQVVAEQGLEQIHKAAQEKIEEYANKTEPLTDSEKIDLARMLTVYAVSGTTSASAELSKNISNLSSSKSYQQYGADNGINIRIRAQDKVFVTSISGVRNVDWGLDTNPYADVQPSNIVNSENDKNRLYNIKNINKAFN